MDRHVRRPHRLRGEIVPPGDKSLSHRAAIFNAIADGAARIERFLPGDDCRGTLRCLQGLGAELRVLEERPDGLTLEVHGRGLDGLSEPSDVLDCGNSGTTMRLLAGLLAGRPFVSILTGDASLRRRPMGRLLGPLREAGAVCVGRAGETLAPFAIQGGTLRGMHHRLAVASAQVKSALVLAGLQADAETTVHEPGPSRDHTERMLSAMGAPVTAEGLCVRVRPLDHELSPCNLRIPGDFSSSAFWAVAAVLHPDAELRLRDVLVNPTRTGLLDALRAMGADVTLENERVQHGEPVADVMARSSRLRGIEVGGALVPRAIDELPLLALAACFAEGETVIRDAAELRAKESDRVASTVAELNRLGARLSELPDGVRVHPVAGLRGAAVDGHGDHRLAMLLAVAGLLAEGETTVRGAEAVAVSYPGFWDDLGRVALGSGG